MITDDSMAINAPSKQTILFLCYHNSARSQMAEGFVRSLYGDLYEAYSAGIEATTVDPRAIQVMKEAGIDISGQQSKTSREYKDIVFDVLVTVCDRARQACPICNTPEIAAINVTNEQPEAKKIVHKSFEDPAGVTGSEEEQLAVFRSIRDEIKEWIILTFRN